MRESVKKTKASSPMKIKTLDTAEFLTAFINSGETSISFDANVELSPNDCEIVVLMKSGKDKFDLSIEHFIEGKTHTVKLLTENIFNLNRAYLVSIELVVKSSKVWKFTTPVLKNADTGFFVKFKGVSL